MKTNISARVVGMKYYNLTAREAIRLLRVQPSLTREPHNTHDTSAIAVTANGNTIGHIDRQTAVIVAPLLDSGAAYEIEVGAVVGQSISVTVCIIRDSQPVSVPKVCGVGVVGIYEICAGNDRYVGQSKDIQNRIAQHWHVLHHGIHQNMHLQQLWRDLGPSRFSANVLELAPKITKSLDLARWLHNRECHWIDAFGGLRMLINADRPRPVLDDLAKRELQRERDAANPGLLSLERRCLELAQFHEKLCSSLDSLRLVVSKAERFWGIFNSGQTETDAETARRRILLLENESRKAIDERILLQDKVTKIKQHLFLLEHRA